MNWYVLYTRPRCEKKAQKQLSSLGIHAYCPLYSKIRLWSDRKKKIDVPLIPSIVFVKVNKKDVNRVFESPAIVRYMFWLGKRAVVRQFEIDILKKYLNGSHNFDNCNISDIKVGDSLRLASFNNEKGIVNRVSNNKLWIYLKSIGCNIKLNLA